MDSKLPRAAFLLGLSGLLPQVALLVLTFSPTESLIGLTGGVLYAALILSFLGGLWWGIAAANPAAPLWLYAVAVVPSLFAFASSVPWLIAQSLELSLVMLGCGLLATPLVDWRLRAMGLVPEGWLAMRVILSIGLGGLTLLLASVA